MFIGDHTMAEELLVDTLHGIYGESSSFVLNTHPVFNRRTMIGWRSQAQVYSGASEPLHACFFVTPTGYMIQETPTFEALHPGGLQTADDAIRWLRGFSGVPVRIVGGLRFSRTVMKGGMPSYWAFVHVRDASVWLDVLPGGEVQHQGLFGI
jgi:hypothetical protein